MNLKERQALRQKHQINSEGYCTFCYQRLFFGIDRGLTGTPYPCDAIKVLNSWEAELGVIEKAMSQDDLMKELTNIQEGLGLYDCSENHIFLRVKYWNYCNDCGEKL
jgi:hypothetical protein